ncbi:ATP-grasp domain-containing protein [Actinacidiphila sp. ITFR-21]|uniref:ATP-grasp domain-containing protein n=1 Tax=Actinacidiphila sp. ITFR-21 TaxID=3075199 RepID=UPI00288C1A0C|nr:ATP-grasp domain-containing protein [Streptomyces sp. ITFR-21]WNI16250.1 ATP-grasp domain-containing protein [Streptomyces sp. ITFR-21]
MRMLRDNPDNVDVRIYGTNVLRDAPALTACDVAEVEPRHVSDADYAEFALEFCRRHRIDVLIPPRRLVALAGLVDDFAAVGTRLMCSPPAAVEVLTSKSRTYEVAAEAGVPVPPWRVVSDAEGFRDAVRELSATGERICIKPAGEYSAFGFRILDDGPLRIKDLLAPPLPLASVAAVADALRRAADEDEAIPEFLVMPYLDGPEVSVDCLSAPGGATLSAIARSKQGRYRHLLDDPALTAIARRLVGHFQLAYLSNVQLRHRGGEPVLLEANPRASAGIFQTALSGVNLPWAAVRLLVSGDAGPLPAPRLGGRLAVTEIATEVDGGTPLALIERPAPAPDPVRVLAEIDTAPGAAPRARREAELLLGEETAKAG